MMSWLMTSALLAAAALAQESTEDNDTAPPQQEDGGSDDGAGLALPYDAAPTRPAVRPRAPAAPPPAPERPLAIPPGQRPPPPPSAPAAAAQPQDNAAKLAAIRQYRRERLEVRPEVEVTGGGSRVQTGFGFGGPYWGTSFVVTDPVRTTRTWGVYQGSERLSVPEFLAATQQLDLKRSIEDDIERYDRRGRTLMGVGVAGLATAVVGTVGARTAPYRSLEQAQYASLVFPGIVVGSGGLILGSIPSARADQLEQYPAQALDITEAQRLADEHNERLRVQLGLSPEDVWPIEAERAP